MKRKSDSLHLDIQTHRKNPYGLLRNSYREDGKVKKETICRLTGLSLEQLRMIQAAIQGKTIFKEDFEIIQSREYGASFASVALMKNLGLHTEIFSRPNENWVRSCLAMIAGRLVFAGSKLSLSHCGSFSALWETCGIDDEINVNTNCYEAMDKLFERQDAIQKKIADKHLSNGTLVLYDITSCYMEGEYEDSDLVEYGYNRDKKRGREQIVISLLCTKNGCPVAVEVLNGNTKDETTVLDKIEEIKKKYGIDKVVFVGDRGMVTRANYEQIDHSVVKIISALTHSKIKSLLEEKIIQIGLFDEKNIVEIVDCGIRYCLCKNPDMAIKEAAARVTLLKKTTDELDKIIACTRKTKYSKEMRAGKILNQYKMGKFFTFEGQGENLKYMLDEAKIEQEASLDGCYIIYTDVLVEDMNAVEVVENYKNLMRVEQAFRNLKTARLEVRPVYHKKDDRIKSHVFICMLAYYVMWHMNQRLKPLFEADGVNEGRKYTFNYVIELLKSIRKETVEVCGHRSFIITRPNEEQKRILQLLKVAI
jgi:transposase